jgi:ParB-like chromosome segregation protein Spo0J
MIEGPYRTKDYNIFKFDSMNREIDERHVKRLVTSFEKKYVEKPIIVNQNIVIMDGQHTFLALKQLGLEISYNIHHGMTIDDVPVLNGNQKAWTFHHYLDFYAN